MFGRSVSLTELHLFQLLLYFKYFDIECIELSNKLVPLCL